MSEENSTTSVERAESFFDDFCASEEVIVQKVDELYQLISAQDETGGKFMGEAQKAKIERGQKASQVELMLSRNKEVVKALISIKTAYLGSKKKFRLD